MLTQRTNKVPSVFALKWKACRMETRNFNKKKIIIIIENSHIIFAFIVYIYQAQDIYSYPFFSFSIFHICFFSFCDLWTENRRREWMMMKGFRENCVKFMYTETLPYILVFIYFFIYWPLRRGFKRRGFMLHQPSKQHQQRTFLKNKKEKWKRFSRPKI